MTELLIFRKIVPFFIFSYFNSSVTQYGHRLILLFKAFFGVSDAPTVPTDVQK